MLRALCSLLLVTAAVRLTAAPSAEGVEFFERRVRPLLAESCYSCHGAEKQKGGLRLDMPGAIRSGGDSGAVIVPGEPEQSRLITAVGYQDEDLKMPPKTRLSSRQVADLTDWVKRGAPMPTNDPVVLATAKKTSGDNDRSRDHWAFRPVEPVAVPAAFGTSSENSIDAFIAERLRGKGLRPNPKATKNELIRRAYYDLTGLPPSPAAVKAFLASTSSNAWADLIDELLASPRYGEKWARHWLDLVRFAESNSYERDNAKPHAWRYRDYVIRAFNDDKPYDRFIREQLAGDEFPDNSRDGLAIVATGFYRLGIWDDEPADAELARYDGLDDIVTTTGQVFLGLTVDCARCHDHKVDPIPQRDYYRLLAFFHNVSPYTNSGPTVELAMPNNPWGRALGVTELGSIPPPTYVLLRGNPNTKGPMVEPGFPAVLAPESAVIQPQSNGKSSGRRTVLANWIASPANPLTARVMVNRIWQHHFGRGLVRSPNNFGLQGDAPTHPELLDWLAGKFVERGWSLKAMHRLMMNSDAYQMSSRGNPEALKLDPANDLFSRFDMRRLTAEEIRDSILAVNGSLNLRMFGPGVYVEIPKQVMAGQSRPGQGWGESPAEDQARRSIYIHVKRSLLTPILETFDVAETDRSTPVRFSTVQPTQALGLLNSEFLNRQAEIFAARLRKEAPESLEQQVRLGLTLVTSRPPTAAEVKRGLGLVESLVAENGASKDGALKYFCLMALNLNEMVYVD